MAFTGLDPEGPLYQSFLTQLREPDRTYGRRTTLPPVPKKETPMPEPAVADQEAVVETVAAGIPGDVPLAVTNAPDHLLAELVVDVEEKLAAADDAYAQKSANARKLVTAGYEELGRRMLARKARAIAHPDLIVTLEPAKTRLDKRPSELTALFDVLPPEELKGAIWRDPPPRADEMPWQSNGTKLAALVRRYGPDSTIARIIARGLVRVEVGLPRVKIERRSKVVDKLVTAADVDRLVDAGEKVLRG